MLECKNIVFTINITTLKEIWKELSMLTENGNLTAQGIIVWF